MKWEEILTETKKDIIKNLPNPEIYDYDEAQVILVLKEKIGEYNKEDELVFYFKRHFNRGNYSWKFIKIEKSDDILTTAKYSIKK